MTTITDDYMRQMLAATRNYSLVILKSGPHRHDEGANSIIWEHGRRNLRSVRRERSLLFARLAMGAR
jgi:hypothetical protein